jgi:MFS family permease
VLTLVVGVSFAALDNVALVFLARDQLGASPAGFGLLNAAFGMGALVATVALMRIGMVAGPGLLFVAGWVLTGVGELATGFVPTLSLAVGVQILAGAGNGIDNVANDTLIQRSVPREMLGRMFGLTGTAAYLGSGVAYAAGGPLLNVVPRGRCSSSPARALSRRRFSRGSFCPLMPDMNSWHSA